MALSREAKEQLLNQKGVCLWFTGLSGSGKSTLAIELEKRLNEQGKMTCLLDGDTIRTGLNNNLGFSAEERRENIRRIAEVSKLMVNNGIICINCFVSPTNDLRDLAEEIIGSEDFKLVFVSTPLEECERRDVKGLYKKARAGEIPNFTGVSAPFDEPQNPAISIDTTDRSVKDCLDELTRSLF